MEGAVPKTIVSADASPELARPNDEDQIIVVRPAVVEHVGHVFGNFFQRIYHLTDQVRDRDASAAEALSGSIRQLEDFLQLVMDYFSPLPLSLEYVPGIDIAQSLAREISDATGCSVKIDGKGSGGRLLVDPGRLARAFALLASHLCHVGSAPVPLDLKTALRQSSRSMALSVKLPADVLAKRTAQSEMQWTVAEKVLESHGGALAQHSSPAGEMAWEIVLPLHS